MIDKSAITSRTHGGLDVFVHYFGKECLSKAFRNPYRDDTRPSCHLRTVSSKDGMKFYMKDFGDSTWSGDCFAITARINNVNLKNCFGEVLRIINRDLSLGLGDYGEVLSTPLKPMTRFSFPASRFTDRSIKSFEASYKSFTPGELAYWGQYGIGMETLVKYHVESLDFCVFRRHDGTDFSVVSSEINPCFAYVFGGGKGLKVYRPKHKMRFMYAGSFPRPYVFGLEQLEERGTVPGDITDVLPDTVFITGGEKDVMSLSAHGFNAVAFNSETASVPDEIMRRLSGRFARIVFLYDMDATGREESGLQVRRYAGEYPVSRLALPLPGTKQEKDISDYFRLGNSSEAFAELFKSQEGSYVL